MTLLELEQREVLDFDQVRALIGRLTRPDGRPVARGTIYRLIHDGLPSHRMSSSPNGRFHFYADEVRAWVDNRWNRPTPDHRGRPHGANGDAQ